MIRATDQEKAWRDLLRESFEFVQSHGGLFALDLEYYTESKKNLTRCYRLLWTNCLAAEIKSGRLLQNECGILRIGPVSETMAAVAEALDELRTVRKQPPFVGARMAA